MEGSWCREAKYDDIQHNDTQQNVSQRNDNHHNDNQRGYTLQNAFKDDTHDVTKHSALLSVTFVLLS